MNIYKRKNLIQLKSAALIIAAATVSACSSSTGFSAGGVSSHTPQSYETLSSAAATTSTLGGSALLGQINASRRFVGMTSAATTGSVTHDTGRIELNDGTYLFVDATGPTATGKINDGAGASGRAGSASFGTAFALGYDYVLPYVFTRTVGSTRPFDAGFSGIIAAAADMPNGGTASYSGQADASFLDAAGNQANDIYLHDGISAVNADFGAGTVTVDLSGFTNVKDGLGTTLLPSTMAFNHLRGTGLTISGAHFTGGSWVTIKDGAVINETVNVVGTSPTSNSNGTFFGYDPSNSAPAEVAGVVVLNGSTASILGLYAAR